MDHVVFVMFENRSLDNLLGRLYGPEDGKAFEGVVGRSLTNPVPDWAEHQPADGSGVVAYDVATDMDAPNPDSGEEWYHTNTQVFGTLDEHNRYQSGDGVTAPWNTPPADAPATMEGFVADYISNYTWQMGVQPTFEQYRQIMTGYTPEQVPVLSGLARDFGVFDHWFCEVPSQTFMNRSFWTAATCTPLPTGGTVNTPLTHWIADNTAETLFDRLESLGRTWKVYVKEPMAFSFTGVIHMPRLKDRFATHFVPFAQFKKDAAAGELPDFCLIEPNLMLGHGDYHPACGRALAPGANVPADPPSSIELGEAFLDEIYRTYRAMRSDSGSNVWNTTLFIGWDEPGGTYDHVPPGAVPAPDPAAPAGQFGFTFERSGYRVPAIVVSPWVESGSVFSDEHRHTSMISTLAKLWGIGTFTQRDAAAKPFDYAFSLEVPRDPEEWVTPDRLPINAYHARWHEYDKALSTLGKGALTGLLAMAKSDGIEIPEESLTPGFQGEGRVASDLLTLLGAQLFPQLGPDESGQAVIRADVQKELATAAFRERHAKRTAAQGSGGS